MIREGAATQTVSDFLDSLAEHARIAASRSLDRQAQRALWKLVDGFRPLRLTDMVPAKAPPLHAIQHFGRNTLPVFTLFEKRFYRAEGRDPSAPGELGGANFQSIQFLTGPGYFVAREDAARGEVLVDYNHVPTTAPSDFSPIVPNKGNRSGLVYGQMIDTLRRVSEHVTIGSAAKNGKPIGSWFTLCRKE